MLEKEKEKEKYKMSWDWSLCLNVNTLNTLKKGRGWKYRKVLPRLMWKLKKHLCQMFGSKVRVDMHGDRSKRTRSMNNNTHKNTMHQRGNNLGCIYKGDFGVLCRIHISRTPIKFYYMHDFMVIG